MCISNIPGLGLKGNNWFGPICLSWKTFRTSSHLLGLPNPNPEPHASKKTQFVHSSTPILTKSRVIRHKKTLVWKLRFLLNLRAAQVSPVHISGFRTQRRRLCGGNAADHHFSAGWRSESCSGVRSLLQRHVVQVSWTRSRGGPAALPAPRGRWAAAGERTAPSSVRPLWVKTWFNYDN